MQHILVVDDEQDLLEILRFNLESEQFAVSTTTSAEDALLLIEKNNFDLILLDVMMESMSGFELARQLRTQGIQTPIIFLTALNAEQDQLNGFNLGADDFISKPFSFATVLARIRAVLRRSTIMESDANKTTLTDGSLQIVIDQALVLIDGNPLPLTKKEYLILLLLFQNRGAFLTRDFILSKVWETDVYVNDRSVDVHIARLRRKMGPLANRIVNRTGFGYSYSA